MKLQYKYLLVFLVLAALINGCAKSPIEPPDVPASLQPPSGQTVILEAYATGVQIYECAPKVGENNAFEWTFRAPEATLADLTGAPLGKHYAGPTWESLDGSTVAGSLVAKDPGPTPSTIPWLLLTAKTNTGTGVFSQVKSIQRVLTVGGIAPADSCSTANVKTVARVPYKARYYFYH